jgi:glycosyltransferase involved in cell wall biosynthesis
MRIAVDGLLYGATPAGVGHYIGHLFRAYAARFPEDALFIALPQEQSIRGAHVFHPLRAGAGSRDRLFYEHRKLARVFRSQGYDAAHFPDYQMPWQGLPKSVLTVHDLVAFRYPETFPTSGRLVKQVLLRRSVQQASHIIVPSQATRDDLVQILNVEPSRITVIWHGVNVPAEFGPNPHPRPYFFFMGTIEPRKNLVRLIQAHRILKGRFGDVPDLVIGGKPGWLYEPVYQEAARVDGGQGVIFLGYVSTADTWAWYRHAEAFCFPTLYEGFGMPLLEAMATGCRIITSNRGAVREVAEGIGLLVDPESPESIADAMEKTWREPAAMAADVARGRERARTLTWTRAAEQTRNVYEKVAAGP